MIRFSKEMRYTWKVGTINQNYPHFRVTYRAAQWQNTATLPEAQLSYPDNKQYEKAVPSKMLLRMASLAGRRALAIVSSQ